MVDIEAEQGETDPAIKALLTPSFLDYAVHVSPKYRYIYIVNPKVGFSSIIWTLQCLETGNKDKFPRRVGTIHDREGSPLKSPSDISSNEQILRDDAYFKFTLVRNPSIV